jgi:hypothetical protein
MADLQGASVTTLPRRRAVRHPVRLAIVVVGLLAVANLAILLVSTSDTSVGGRRPLPFDVETIAPERGALVGPRVTVSADLRDSLTGVLLIDGVEVPEDQLERLPEIGLMSFRPGEDRDLTKFDAGLHTVVVQYWPRNETRPDRPSSYSWSFQVGA